uniref:Uncharacterized protein n=1 Tax=Clastoptera arizonana TaxID=38151 RepID=A0A1B6E0H2_9HEMI
MLYFFKFLIFFVVYVVSKKRIDYLVKINEYGLKLAQTMSAHSDKILLKQPNIKLRCSELADIVEREGKHLMMVQEMWNKTGCPNQEWSNEITAMLVKIEKLKENTEEDEKKILTLHDAYKNIYQLRLKLQLDGICGFNIFYSNTFDLTKSELLNEYNDMGI